MRASVGVALLVCASAGLAQFRTEIRPRPADPFHGADVQVASQSPFPAGCEGTQTGTNYRNAPVEPFVTVDPRNPDHLIAGWQQDRWSNGGSNGLLSGTSMDRGRTWTISYAHFSVCSGGTYDRASDPWVAISPNGVAHYAALSLIGAGATTAVLVSRSADGGFTWDQPLTLQKDNTGGADKESITADPNDDRYVYMIWDRLANRGAQAWLSRSTDNGLTWEPARVIFDPGTAGYATANQIVVLPDGTLVDIFVLSYNTASGKTPGVWTAAMRSLDHGATWSAPILIFPNQTIGTVDAKTQTGLRTGAGIPSASVDQTSGAVYAAWSDAHYNGGQRDGIVLSKSTDGGLTWSIPVQVNQAPNVQAFTPAVAAGPAGTVAVTYYDFRQDSGDPNTLLASYWRIVSQDGGLTWRETPVAGPFDIRSAPVANGMPFLGDYQGLAATGGLFVSFFIAADSGNTSSAFASSLSHPADTRSTNPRTEINLDPKPYRAGEKPEPQKHSAK